MKTARNPVEEWAERVVIRDGLSLEDILSRYETTVFTLAMHLTNDEVASKQVTIDVFIRLTLESRDYEAEPLDSLIHRFTYDAALSALLNKVRDQANDLSELHLEMTGTDGKLCC
jgi:hypothetical protein